MDVKVRISSTIAYEYEARAVYEFIGKAGVYTLTTEQATELKEDAIHQAFDTDCTPAGTVRAYAALASNLMEALGATH